MTKQIRERESTIETYLEDKCLERNWLCQKSGAVGSSGFPDRIIVTNDGTVVFCEVKRPGEKPRKLQLKMFLVPLAEHNANVCVVSNAEQVEELVYQLEHGTNPKPQDLTSFYIAKR